MKLIGFLLKHLSHQSKFGAGGEFDQEKMVVIGTWRAGEHIMWAS
tara:strand:- start:31117 stop:31251 length:135 start_codon:yes stop_codon:yes gene_type:complete